MELNRKLIYLGGGASLPYSEELLRIGEIDTSSLYSRSRECAEKLGTAGI